MLNALEKIVFHIGKTPIYGDVVLAPMDGITDSPFRRLARRFGSAFCYTEFINAIDVIHGTPYLEKRLAFMAEERPIAFQILDNDADRIYLAAQQLMKFSPDFIDINLGCAARSVSSRGAGSGLLKSPGTVAAIFRNLAKSIDVPVTAKMRLGWDDDSKNYLDIAKVIEDNGGNLIAIHGRTRQQAYQGRSDWNAIAQVKNRVSIPVIANGDVRSVMDIDMVKNYTGCDAVMIGRGALGNPWIFSRVERERVSPGEMFTTIQSHLKLLIEFYGELRGVLLFRKHVIQYLFRFTAFDKIKPELLEATTFLRVMQLVRQIIEFG